MTVRIRLTLCGSKKRKVYRIVVAESSAPRDGKFIEVVGHYDPNKTENKVTIKEDRIRYWLSVGASPSLIVAKLVYRVGMTEIAKHAKIAAKQHFQKFLEGQAQASQS